MRGINISIPYANKQGVAHTLTISMSLKYTVSNSSASESVESIRANAPAQYYTQNRMITGEDYNLAPLANSQEIIKVKAINRTSSGISRNFDIIDASGKYSNVNVFADDGFIYKNETEESLAFKFNNRVEIINYIRRTIEPLIDSIIPKFVFDLPSSIENEMVNQISQNRNFGIRYDFDTATWKIVTSGNLNLTNDFTLEKSGDSTNNNLDASWLVSFVKDVDQYVITVRLVEYVVGSKEQNRFYFDDNERAYNEQTGLVGKDVVNILKINTLPNSSVPVSRDILFEIDDTVKFNDGYESSTEIKVAFSDKDSDGVIDDPECFNDIVGAESVNDFIFFEEITTDTGESEFLLTDKVIQIARRESDVNISNYQNNDLVYFYDIDENRVKRADRVTNTWVLESKYRGNKGRRNLKFQYIHNASVDRRIDPSTSNIIDIFLLTRSYDQQFRQFLTGALPQLPAPPTSESLRISFGSKLSAIKAISDEIIYHPVKYKVLFGQNAEDKLRAQFKVVKNPNRAINDNDLKVRIITAINEFFDVDNWDFGDRFYLGELITYIVNSVAPDISNLVILPRQTNQVFGSLFEIQSAADEIFVSGATVDDVEIVSAINAAEVRANPATIVNVT
jgi:hypothetical protein